MNRRQNFQNLAWFYDLHTRHILDLDPPYQRRSVWNQAFKDYFVETVLLDYPAPAIFLYEEITPAGRSQYHVVDGKQRLTTLFEFVADQYPVSEGSDIGVQRGKYFSSLDDAVKRSFWGYQFLVEYVPSGDEKVINGIFDRINRNVAKLSAQELRHARLDGKFIETAEDLSDWMTKLLPQNFPRIATQSRKQMKDVELTALLLLLLEEGPESYSQEELDKAFSDRDQSWDKKIESEQKFRSTVNAIKAILDVKPGGEDISASRLKNQADFYSLFGALAKSDMRFEPDLFAKRLIKFLGRVDDDEQRKANKRLSEYYDAARSASSDRGPRETRIAYISDVLLGKVE